MGPERYDVLVIGGGFYGLFLAEFAAARFRRVLLCEAGPGLMRRASYANQARVHNGYHYPRSVLTATRSRANFPRFVEEFAPAIDSSFEKVYAIGRRFSKLLLSRPRAMTKATCLSFHHTTKCLPPSQREYFQFEATPSG